MKSSNLLDMQYPLAYTEDMSKTKQTTGKGNEMNKTKTATEADKLASAARYGGGRWHCVGDVENGRLRVTGLEWEHLPQRAKRLGAKRILQDRGIRPATGRASLRVQAADGSVCTVLLDE